METDRRDIKDKVEAEMEEEVSARHRRSWADMTEHEEEDKDKLEEEKEEVVNDDLTGRVLKYKQDIEARLNEIAALIKMGVWEIASLSRCLTRTQR